MAAKTIKMKPQSEVKLTAAEARLRVHELEEELENEKSKLWCRLCGKKKKPDYFYFDSDPRSQSHYSGICRDCAKAIALRRDANGEDHEPTKESCQEALFYLNRPFTEKLWDSSLGEVANEASGQVKHNVWASLVKNSAMPQYIGQGWRDSDMFKTHIKYEDEKTVEDVVAGREDQDTYSDFLKNKADVTRLLSYDPFEQEKISDQPFLYSQLLGLLDASEDANDDMMRTASCISIVRGFLQLSKIDDTIAKLMSDLSQVQNNSATIKSLQESKGKVTGMIKDLAAESCISLKNSKNAKKGENTFTGKLQRLGKMSLREAENNGFDIETCKGMQQVANISMSAIIDKLNNDDSEWADIVKQQRSMVAEALKKADGYAEAFRLVLRENLDLRKELKDNHLLDSLNLLNLEDVINSYIEKSEEDGE